MHEITSEDTSESTSEASRPRSVRAQFPPSRPSERAVSHLEQASRRVRGRNTQIRRSFIRGESDQPAPLSRIVRSGRAASLRLRLMLALLWMGGGGDQRHEVTFPARAWAELLDLTDPAGRGERRVRDAVAWLERTRLIVVERPPGRPPTIRLLRDDASGEPYVPPVRAPKDASTGKLAPRDWSVRLPSSFWRHGWALALSTPALALLLVMLDAEHEERKPFWIAPDEARRRYGLSEDTWTRGLSELSAFGLVAKKRKPVSTTFGWTRVRNEYLVNRARLEAPPAWSDR